MILPKKRRKTRAIIWFHLFGYPESMNVRETTHLAASNSKPMSSQVNNILNKSMRNHVAGACMRNSARYSAIVLYKFSGVSSVPFYSN